MNGVFPETYPEVLALKGVGEYTAAAICSFAYGMPYAVVDGNVYRVLSRYFGIDTPIDSTEGKKLFAALADEMLDKKQPALYNQGIMDFGAIQCTPQSPDCLFCPLGALMPQSRIICIVSRFTACGLYLRILRRDRMVSITAFSLLCSAPVFAFSFCACVLHPMHISKPAPNKIDFKFFILY